MHQSSRVRKPSHYAKRIASGEGTADGTEDSVSPAELVVDIDMFPEKGQKEAEATYLADLEDAIAAAVEEVDEDPKLLREAQSCSNWPCWKEAMDHKIESLKQAGTWDTVARPPSKNVVGCKWVFRLKRKADGSIDKYKAHLVARRFTQVYGVDYLNTYSPIAKLTSFRTILTLATRFDWEIECFDFNTVYLNGKLEELEEIYMEQPLGYEEGGAGFVKHLKKVLYGLKQVGRRWYDTFAHELANLGFRASATDPGVFYTWIKSHILILVAHVDDCAMTRSSGRLIGVYKIKLNNKFPLC